MASLVFFLKNLTAKVSAKFNIKTHLKIHRGVATFLVIFSTLGGLGWGFWLLDEKGFFNLNQIEILVEEVPTQRAHLKNQIGKLEDEIESLRGSSLWRLPLGPLSTKLNVKGWIETTEISRRWPDTLRVKIKPARIYLLYVSSKGLKPIIENGKFLEAVRVSEAPDVPHLRGTDFETDIALRKEAVDLVRMIPERGKFALGAISEIRHDPKDGFWVSLMGSQIKVKMGTEKVSLKSARINQVLTYLDQRGLNARVIDADLSQKVLVRLRKDP